MEYLVTAHQPTSVSHSLRGLFTSSSHDSLAIVRSNSISLLDLLPSGPVEACKPIELWGRVMGAEVWTPSPPLASTSTPLAGESPVESTSGQSYLLILLDAPPKPLLLVTRFSAGSGTLEVIERIEIARPVGTRENEFWQGLIVDQPSGTVVAGIWCGSLSVVVLGDPVTVGAATGKRPARGKAAQQGLIKSRFDVQLRDLNLLSLIFVPPTASGPSTPLDPTLAFLTLTPTREPFLRTRTLLLDSKDLSPSSDDTDLIACHLADESALMLVPIPAPPSGGNSAIMVVGESTNTVYEVVPPSHSTGTPGKGKARANSSASANGVGAVGAGKRRRSSATETSTILSAAGRKVPRIEENGIGGSGLAGEARTVVRGEMPFSEITAWEVVDSTDSFARVLLGDSRGQMKLITLQRSASLWIEKVQTLVLGVTSPVKCLTYLTSSHFFVGSHFADSLILQLLPSPIPYAGTYLAPPSSTYANLAPILDFCTAVQGEGQVVTCSGGNGGGSLRVVHDGAGWEEEVVVEGLVGVERAWTVPKGTGLENSYAVLSTGAITILLSLAVEDNSMTDAPSTSPSLNVTLASVDLELDLSQPTLAFGVMGGRMIQVTPTKVSMVDLATGQRSEWKPDDGVEITVADVSKDGGEGVVVGLSDRHVVALRASTDGLALWRSRDVPSDVATVTISASTVYFATWGNCILAWDLADKAVMFDTTIFKPSCSLVRSLVLLKSSKVDQPSVLLAGLGDGCVLVSIVDERGRAMECSKARKLVLGSTAVDLTLAENGTVLATCDKPAVLQLEDRGRVGYKYLSVKNIFASCSTVEVTKQPNSFLLVTTDALAFGHLNNSSNAQIQTVAFEGSNPYRIAYSPQMRSYGVAFIKTQIDRHTREEILSSSFKVLREDFSTAFEYTLLEGERATALERVTLETPSTGKSELADYFVLGTAQLETDSSEVRKGRIVLFAPGPDGNLRKVHSLHVAGMVYAIAQVKSNGFVATVNSRIIVCTTRPGSPPPNLTIDLAMRSQWTSAYLPASLAPVGERGLLVGDAMSSLAVLEMTFDSTLHTVAKDLKPLWTTSVGVISETNFIGADVDCNLSTLKLADKSTLEEGGAFHLGDIVNKFRKGSLRPNQQLDPIVSPNLIFATSSGRIAALADLIGPETSKTLFDLQRNMARVILGFGGVSHVDWRSYRAASGSRPSAGFIDGDFVERFLDIQDEEVITDIMEGASKWEKIEVPYGELCGILEGLRRVH